MTEPRHGDRMRCEFCGEEFFVDEDADKCLLAAHKEITALRAQLAAAEERARRAEEMLTSWRAAADEDIAALEEAGISMRGHAIVYGIRKLAAAQAEIERLRNSEV